MKERIVRTVAETKVLTSSLLTYFGNSSWIWISLFVDVNLLQSSITKFCPLEKILGALGVDSKKNKNKKKGN